MLGPDPDENLANDGVLDESPWDAILDAVAVSDGGLTDTHYAGAPVLGPDFPGETGRPFGASRIPDGNDTNAPSDWVRNDRNGEGLPCTGCSDGVLPVSGVAVSTPGAANSVVP